MRISNKIINSVIIGAVIVLFLAYFFKSQSHQTDTQQHSSQTQYTPQQLEQTSPKQASPKSKNIHHSAVYNSSNGAAQIQQAFLNRQSNVQIQGIGQVKAVLPDDNDGSRHQKIILNLENGHTILVAQNIDLAPKIQNLKKGDTVEFFGEYEYSDKGGVMHWTHHDPQKRHVDGWLKHKGQIYQ
ncbi:MULTISPECIES: DUF3465 domain-containing protein [unclassified Acinetobacter]|uniref:DUF3465 domain-containing protein n=1 Tax=unclassified Acinetobacter TaxID=196816 RepID=UPI0035B90422